MKKKTMSLIFLLLLVFTFVSCTNKSESNNDSQNNNTNVHTHTYLEVSARNATCTQAGNELYYTCSCGKMFDASKNEITSIPTIKALGHEYKEHIDLYAAISTDYVSTYFTCTRCDAYFNEDKEEIAAMNSDTDRLSKYLTKVDKENFVSRDFEILYTDEFKATVLALEESINKIITDGVEDFSVLDKATDDLVYYQKVLKDSADQLELVAYWLGYDEYYTWLADCSDFKNSLSTYFNEMYINMAKSKYRNDFYPGWTEAQIDAYVASLDPDADKVNNELDSAITNAENAYLAGTITEAEEINLVKENGNKLAKNLGYNNYLDYLFENIYGRKYTVSQMLDLKDSIIDYFVPLYSKYWTLYKNQMDSLSSEQNAIASKLIDNESFFNHTDWIEAYLKDLGGTMYDNYKYLFTEGNFYYNKAEVDNMTSFVLKGTSGIYMATTRPYANTRTFVHEFGHYNADRNGDFPSYDLCEIHSQGDEVLFALYLLNHPDLIDNEIAKAYLYWNLYVLVYDVVDGYEAFEFENYLYSTDTTFTNDMLDAYNTNLHSQYHMRCDYAYTACVNLGYYISYSSSAFSSLDLYLIGKNDYEAGKAAYHKLYNCSDVLPDVDYATVCNYAGIKTMLTKENVIALGKAL